MSCSSSMSPTISSRMSSRVTRPIRAPYSSTTRAVWEWRSRNAASCSDNVVVSGTNQGSVATFMISMPDGLPPRRHSSRSRSLACSTPTMLSGSSRHSGMRV